MIISYDNSLQNRWGPENDAYFDITSKSQDDFKMFLANHPDLEHNPIELDVNQALASCVAQLSITKYVTFNTNQ